MNELIILFHGLIHTLGEAFQTLLPILAFFALFQVLYLKLPREVLARVGFGLLLSLAGLTLFLFGVE